MPLDRHTRLFMLALVASGCRDSTSPNEGPRILEERLSAGTYHSCALTPMGGAMCWGQGYFGALGAPPPHDCGDPPHVSRLCSRTPVAVSGGLTFRSISAGDVHTCGITADARAYCWGSNEYGELGTGPTGERCGETSRPCSSAPREVHGSRRFLSISARGSHTCAVTTEHLAYCWGYGALGRLGDGRTNNSELPVPVAGGLRFAFVRAGGTHTCGLSTDARAYCWGYNHLGQLGDGTTRGHSVPQPVLGDLRFDAISLGTATTCALEAGTGDVYCWGFGQADGAPATRAPIAFAAASPATAISVGSSLACALAAETVRCWGDNDSGQLGRGSDAPNGPPAPVAGALRFAEVSAGYNHACGRTVDDDVYCWGSNYHGLVGNGSSDNAPVSTPVLIYSPSASGR